MRDISSMRADIPALRSGLVYLDNAATTLKPQAVIDSMNAYYSDYPANVHRGVYSISERATGEFESAREAVQHFFNARFPEEIIFTSGTTQSLNVASRLVGQILQPGDSVLLSQFEHHSNIIPWQLLAKEKGITLQYLPLTETGVLDIDAWDRIVTDHTKILSITHLSNASGALTDLAELTKRAHARGMLVIVDGAQSAPHMTVDVQALDIDMFACSAHKMLGPTGTGLLYMRKELHARFEPVIGGGSMIAEVSLYDATWAESPAKYEAGTPNIAGVIGWGAAIEYINSFGIAHIETHISALSAYMYDQLATLPFVRVYGPTNPEDRHSIASFGVEGVHPHDVATILDSHNIAVRAGHHCAQPLMKHWNVPATTRASLYAYNTREDIDALISALHTAYNTFHRD